MKKTVKMFTWKGQWVIQDGDVIKIYKKGYDAWQYILLLKGIRPKVPMGERSLYPVKSLDPRPAFAGKRVTMEVAR